MRFNNNSQFAGLHSFLGASKSSWLNYDEEQLVRMYKTHMAAQRGTDEHNVAAELIRLGIKMGRERKTLNLYVNDAIGYRMSPEVTLFYSINAFGCADAIKCGPEKNFPKPVLRVHDLKTGKIPGKFEQLKIYCAYYCLEYDTLPQELIMLLRIYQDNAFVEQEVTAGDIAPIISKIKSFDTVITKMREEANL